MVRRAKKRAKWVTTAIIAVAMAFVCAIRKTIAAPGGGIKGFIAHFLDCLTK